MNVKKGDLAIIIAGYGNEGKLVEVLEFLGENPKYNGITWCLPSGVRWLVKSLGSPILTKKGRMLMTCPVLESRLLPIQGLPKEDSVKDKKDEPIFRV